ncbi:hypothetical protein HY025_00385 [Candidatus Daviesbacteria bacterium]|nr:hypothetical protein [Candidatus Daviesbacteria bacterium]
MEKLRSPEETATLLTAIQNHERFRILKPANQMRKQHGLPDTTQEEVIQGRANQIIQDIALRKERGQ